jgi:hypothetical protein
MNWAWTGKKGRRLGMTMEAWQCPECGERHEPEFNECWGCGYVRGSGGDETLKETSVSDPMVCPTCKLTLDFLGTKKFHEGSRAAPFLLGEIGELLVKRESYDVYLCSRCGRIELFMDGVGEEFRPQ